jgi:hypothetical protein
MSDHHTAPLQRAGSISTQLTNMHLPKQKENFAHPHPPKKVAVEVRRIARSLCLTRFTYTGMLFLGWMLLL